MIDLFGTDVSRSSGSVLDDDRLAPFAREPIPDQPRNGVGRSAGREGNNDLYGVIRIVFGMCRTGHQRGQGKRKRERGTAEASPRPGVHVAHAIASLLSAG